ncbi:MAG: hypothetical protein AAF492_15530, partial [Verrucomicrobiota bacterium]
MSRTKPWGSHLCCIIGFLFGFWANEAGAQCCGGHGGGTNSGHAVVSMSFLSPDTMAVDVMITGARFAPTSSVTNVASLSYSNVGISATLRLTNLLENVEYQVCVVPVNWTNSGAFDVTTTYRRPQGDPQCIRVDSNDQSSASSYWDDTGVEDTKHSLELCGCSGASSAPVGTPSPILGGVSGGVSMGPSTRPISLFAHNLSPQSAWPTKRSWSREQYKSPEAYKAIYKRSGTNYLRQVITPTFVADVDWDGVSSSYSLGFYEVADFVAGNLTNDGTASWAYTVFDTPSAAVKYYDTVGKSAFSKVLIERTVSNNTPTIALIHTTYDNSGAVMASNTYSYSRIDASNSTRWTLSLPGGLTQERLLTNGTVIVSESGPGGVSSRSEEIYADYGWGDVLIRRIVDAPEGELIDTWHYYTHPTNHGYGQVRQVVRSDGSWEKYEYRADGNLWKLMTPMKNAGTNDSAQHLIRRYEPKTISAYFGADRWVENKPGYEYIEYGTNGSSILINEYFYGSTNAVLTLGANPLTNYVVVVTQVQYMAGLELKTITKTWDGSNVVTWLADRTLYEENPDGTTVSYTYAPGNYLENGESFEVD